MKHFSRQKKSRGPSLGFRYNYFVLAAALGAPSGWIENLGVVPLFLFSAFLFAPAFFAFLNLLFEVTHVLETIGKLLYNRYLSNGSNTNIYNQIYKPFFLPIFNPCVKGFFVNLMVMLLIFFSSIPQASALEIVLGKGETYLFNEFKISKFSISNKEVITYKFYEKNHSLLIKADKLGQSDVLIWRENSEEPVVYQILSLSKIQDAKITQISHMVTGLGLSTVSSHPFLKVIGNIENRSHYLAFKKLLKVHKDFLIDQTDISANLKTELLTDVYWLLLKEFKDQTRCEFYKSQLRCFSPKSEVLSDSFKRYLQNQFAIDWVTTDAVKSLSNYWFKLKIIQIEQLDGEEIKLGLDALSTSIHDLIKLPMMTIIEKNSVLINQKKISLSTLAEPSGIIRSGEPSLFQIGAEIPYQSKDNAQANMTTQWNFAGLRIKLKLENFGKKIKLAYETELTKPTKDSEGAIGGSKSQSSVIINVDKPIVLFELMIKTTSDDVSQFPLLSQIPILGEIFKSKSKQNNYKKISALLELTEQESL
jgi:hypothetical protein